MLNAIALALLQASTPDVGTRAADTAQYLLGAAVIAGVALLYRMDKRLGTIETLLTHPERGLIQEVILKGKRLHKLRNVVFQHQFELRDIRRAIEMPEPVGAESLDLEDRP